MTKNRPTPDFSVVIPIHNESTILAASVEMLYEELAEAELGCFEIILAENGSTDDTAEIAAHLAANRPGVSTFSTQKPNYGLALRKGLLLARGQYVVCDEIDLLDLVFYRTALGLLRDAEVHMVVGSKLLEGSRDNRGLYRHSASLLINVMLRLLTGFKGTDTHGLKAFCRLPVLPFVHACTVDKNLFASELVIRVGKDPSLFLQEIPYSVSERRPPSTGLIKRVPAVLVDLVRLARIFRFGRR